MNEQYQDSPKQARNPLFREAQNTPQTTAVKMMPMLLNDLNQATMGTAELVEQMEKQLDAIASPEDSVPEPPTNKEVTCFPPALEMLRNILKRVNAINGRLSSLRRRVEL